MSDKETILAALRSNQPPQVELPDLAALEPIRYSDLPSQFDASVNSVGGSVVRTARGSAAETVRKLPSARDAARIASTAAWFEGNVDWGGVQRQHELADVDLCVAEGAFGVAENGAVWVSADSPAERVALFLSQHLVLAIPIGEIAPTMHEAYARLKFPESSEEQGGSFGVFISGPSKTADIEQSLVIGAHGARSLHVLLLED